MLYLRDVLLLLSGFVCIYQLHLLSFLLSLHLRRSLPMVSCNRASSSSLASSQNTLIIKMADRHVAGQCRWLVLLTDARRGTQLGGSTHYANIHETEVIFAAFLSDSYCIKLCSSQLTFIYD